MKIRFFFTFVLLLNIITSFGQSKAYLKEEADDYFKVGRYWDAFFLYRDIAKLPEFQGDTQVDSQIKNSSKAMFHWKKTEDFRAFHKYEQAKQHLSDLLILNPFDPNKDLLPRLTLEQANELQRSALNQRTQEGTNLMLAKAVQLYNLALNEGLKDEMVFSLIKQCEFTLSKNAYSGVKIPTSYGINYAKEEERQREVKVIKEEAKSKLDPKPVVIKEN
jgi:tetratricopeptide (TPR) repeat protein